MREHVAPLLIMGKLGEPLISTRDLAEHFNVPHEWVLTRCHMEVAEVHRTSAGSMLMLDYAGVSRVFGGTRKLLGSAQRRRAMVGYLQARGRNVRDHERLAHYYSLLAAWAPTGEVQ